MLSLHVTRNRFRDLCMTGKDSLSGSPAPRKASYLICVTDGKSSVLCCYSLPLSLCSLIVENMVFNINIRKGDLTEACLLFGLE